MLHILLIWAIFEIRLMLSLPLIISYSSAGRAERTLKYFIIQIIRGLLFLRLIVFSQPIYYFIELIILLKLGAFPFFMWVPHVYSGLNYFSIGLLRSVIKFPRFVIVPIVCQLNFIVFIAAISIFIGSITGVLLSRIKSLLRYSRISHTGWLIILSVYEFDWWVYYLTYTLLVIMAIRWLSLNRVKRVYQLINMSYLLLFYTIRVILAMAGMPPTLGFYLKLLGLSARRDISFWLFTGLVLSITVRVYYYSTLFLRSLLNLSKPSKKVSFSVRKRIFILRIIFIVPFYI